MSKTLIFSGATKDFAKTCRVEIIDDDHTERQETFVVSIWNSNLHIDPEHQESTIIIIDDDGMYDLKPEVLRNHQNYLGTASYLNCRSTGGYHRLPPVGPCWANYQQ